MRIIEFDNAHRQKHFRYFRDMEYPHFSIVTALDVSVLEEFIRDHRLHFTGTIVFLIASAANAVPEFRWRIRGDQVVEHDIVHPSFSVATKDTDVFSFCEVKFNTNYPVFANAVREAQAAMHAEPSFEDAPDRDDYLFMSSVPWIHFTGFTHPMGIPARDSVPRFAWGKIQTTGHQSRMPLNVQAHHAVVDGRHMGMCIEQMEAYLADPECVIRI